MKNVKSLRIAVSQEKTNYHNGRITDMLDSVPIKSNIHYYCCGKESIQDYNKRVLQFIVSTQPKKLKESIFTSGRDDNEDGFVYIKKGAYMGYGYIPKIENKKDDMNLQKHLIANKDTRDARRIISSYLRKMNV